MNYLEILNPQYMKIKKSKNYFNRKTFIILIDYLWEANFEY